MPRFGKVQGFSKRYRGRRLPNNALCNRTYPPEAYMCTHFLLLSQFLLLLKHACRKATGRCSTRGGSQGMYITVASTIRQKQLWLLGHVHVSAKNIFKKPYIPKSIEKPVNFNRIDIGSRNEDG